MKELSSHSLVGSKTPSAKKWDLGLVVAPDPEFPITIMLPVIWLQSKLRRHCMATDCAGSKVTLSVHHEET